jgi:hypothetical protein
MILPGLPSRVAVAKRKQRLAHMSE